MERIIHVVCSHYDGEYFLHGAFESEDEAVEMLEDTVEEMNREFEREREQLYVRDDCRYEVREVSLKIEEEDPRKVRRW